MKNLTEDKVTLQVGAIIGVTDNSISTEVDRILRSNSSTESQKADNQHPDEETPYAGVIAKSN